MSSLNFMMSASGAEGAVLSFYLIMFQNLLGLYFSMSGILNCSCAFLSLHLSLNALYLSFVSLCFLPYMRFVCLYCCRAVLHSSSNHGARCFDHLFGLEFMRAFFLVMTPAFLASAIRNSSILLVRISLSSWYMSVMVVNCVPKMVVDVCSFQVFAL